MNRRFFDLVPDDGGNDLSFAAQMLARGFVVVLVDLPGVGDSSRPQDLFSLTPALLVQAIGRSVAAVVGGLRGGTLNSGLPALPGLPVVGVGHSMGAMLTVMLQAEFRPCRAIALLGFSTAGLPQFVHAEALSLARADLPAARRQLVPLARAQFGLAPSTRRGAGQAGDLFASANAELRAVLALKAAMAPLLPVPAMLAMLPGNIARECAAIDVPVFIGVGEFDMTGPAQAIPAAFAGSREVSLHVLENAGHSHFLFAARAQLFDQLAAWAAALVH